jgi:hypothetical protein
MPWCDTYAMTQHLAEIARHVDEDAHAILIMDQASWATGKSIGGKAVCLLSGVAFGEIGGRRYGYIGNCGSVI